MNPDPIVNIYTLALGPFSSLTDLHAQLSNHEDTFAIAMWESNFEIVQSVSHSVVRLEDGLHVSVVTATLECPDHPNAHEHTSS